jgi:hypothetical protein
MLEFSSEAGYSGGVDRQRLSIWAAGAAGFLTASIAALILCQSPQASTPAVALVVLAVTYLTVTAASGATGSYVYWVRSRTWPAAEMSALLQGTLSGWVWIPAIVLLSRQDSVWAPAVAAAGAVVLAVSLRRSGSAAFEPVWVEEAGEAAELFARTLEKAPVEWYGPVVAICLFGEAIALARGWLFPACALLAVAGFAFAWARAGAKRAGTQRIRSITTVALRQSKSAVPALTVTVLAMLIGVRHDMQAWGLGAGIGHGAEAAQTQKSATAVGAGEHLSIVLLTAPQMPQYFAPLARNPLLQGSRLIKPMVIPFDGEYWYFQPPDIEPARGAYRSHASPLTANIHSASASPLLMQAHQHLGAPLPVDCCREVDVQIENRMDGSGALAVGLMLTDSAAPGMPSLLVGEEPVASHGIAAAGRPGFERMTLRFRIPAQTGPVRERIKQFDQMDFAIVADPSHVQAGPRMAIRSLELVP